MEKLAQLPNIVGCKLSHGNLDDHTLIALSPRIDHSRFRVYTGLGQQLLGVLNVGGSGAIDGLANIFPRSMVNLYQLFQAREHAGEEKASQLAQQMRELQYKICRGEKLVAKWGVTGIREAVARVLGYGQNDGGRWPLKGGFPAGDAEWLQWQGVIDDLQTVETSLEKQQQQQQQ
jgi:2-keto-3-deoxy-L-rhamnonate aldolase